MNHTAVLFLALLPASIALAEPVTYTVDPNHTFPSFEADHQGGLSIWRGKINSTRGTIVLDRAARSGTVDVTMDMNTIDFGLDRMNKHAVADDILDVEKFPTASYRGKITFNGESPEAVDGTLTLHGVSKEVKLAIVSFLCKTNPTTKVDKCGADVAASFNRDDFGVDFGKALGFRMAVKLAIQVEAIRDK